MHEHVGVCTQSAVYQLTELQSHWMQITYFVAYLVEKHAITFLNNFTVSVV
jgi:hypothetical protein